MRFLPLALGGLIFCAPALADQTDSPEQARSTCESIADGPPLAVALGEADLGSARGACPRSELALGGRGSALIDAPHFYGALGADARLSGSWAVTSKAELFGTLEALHWQFVQNATLKGSELTLGALTLGGTYLIVDSSAWALSAVARVLLPTSFAVPNERTYGGEVGLAASLPLTERLDAFGYLSADLTAGWSAGPSLPQRGRLLELGASGRPWRWLALVADLKIHSGAVAPVDYFAPEVALRLGGRLSVELAAAVPVWGADRRNGIVGVRIAYLP